ncbi:hypothetical protein ccbrp13_56040 [Ktedonobacteria bacterium brp13]|nr:hypothetical protein ccbrp13_56040 [Ktedonobacteria bacterium brp13]
MSSTSENINPHNVDVNQARHIAMDFIQVHVARGDTPEQMTEGHMGRISWNHKVQVGGSSRVFDKLHTFNRYRVVVTQLDDQPCILQFDIIDLINEIRQSAKQMPLF